MAYCLRSTTGRAIERAALAARRRSAIAHREKEVEEREIEDKKL